MLAVAVATALSHLVDGILIVIQPGKSHVTLVKNMIEQLRRANGNILEVVIKCMDRRGKHYAQRYGYYTRSKYGHYYQAEDEYPDESRE